jgi:hypothetical protein
MARIQILELPSKQVGEYYETPFAIVIDGYDDTDTPVTPALRDEIAAQTGAAGVIFSVVPLDVA